MKSWDVGLVRHLGIRFVETGKDRVVAELEIRPELLTTTGALHSPVPSRLRTSIRTSPSPPVVYAAICSP